MKARKLKPWSRGPMRDVTRIHDRKDFEVGAVMQCLTIAGFRYVLELSCGHQVGRHLLRTRGDPRDKRRTRCSSCKLVREST